MGSHSRSSVKQVLGITDMREWADRILYRIALLCATPLAIGYFLWRSRKDRMYRQHLAERFGVIVPHHRRPIWLHVVSIGEFRACLTLINRLLELGETIHLACITPVARRAIAETYAEAIDNGTVSVSWAPLDTVGSVVRAIRRIQPKAILVSEIEIWPEQIIQAARHNIPLVLVNAQYLERSYQRDCRTSGWRFRAIGHVHTACVKSATHAARFQSTGIARIAVTGELRFDQPLPAALINQGIDNRAAFARNRPTIAMVSVIEGEDTLCIDAIVALRHEATESGRPQPLIIYVPRAPERFGLVYQQLIARGLVVKRRSELFDSTFHPQTPLLEPIDVLLGDSMGEMYGYLAMADQVVVGGSFAPKGAHNISEAIALGKPVYTGPFLHTIEFPAVEAKAAGVLRVVDNTSAALVNALSEPAPDPQKIREFFSAHTGATERTISVIRSILDHQNL